MRQKVTAPRLHDFIKALGSAATTRSKFIQQEGKIAFFHYDFYAQALAKIERGHDSDIRDVQEMIGRGLIEPERLLELLSRIEDQLYRYPAIDGASFRRNVEQTVAEANQHGGMV
jgi:hypothetical protein